MNPEFSYELWDDCDNRQFVAREFPWFLDTYNSYPNEIYRVDTIRYLYLYLHGGFYIDLDTECVKALEPLVHTRDVLLGRMGNDTAFAHSIPNAIMASPPRQEFWLFLVYLLRHRSRLRLMPEHSTGPALLRTAVTLYWHDRTEKETWRAVLRCDEIYDEAILRFNRIGKAISGYYSGVLGAKVAFTGTCNRAGNVFIEFETAVADQGIVRVSIEGQFCDDVGVGAVTVHIPERRLRTGEWLAHSANALHHKRAIRSMISQLKIGQHPRPSRSTLTILDPGKWYAINWSRNEHHLLCRAVVDGRDLEDETKRKLSADAYLLTYWTHSWRVPEE